LISTFALRCEVVKTVQEFGYLLARSVVIVMSS